MCPGNWKQFPNCGVDACGGKGIRGEEAAGLCQASMTHAWGAHILYHPNLDSFESGRGTDSEYVRKQESPGKTRLWVTLPEAP